MLSYNNAPFKKEDWESIQSLQQSGKAKNPFKVGKFGIGFNSVYDITGKRGDGIKKRVRAMPGIIIITSNEKILKM